MEKIKVLIAGSTFNTKLCAESLRINDVFEITRVLTPSPKPTGRKKVIKENPLHEWAKTHKINYTTIDKKINEETKAELAHETPDILLVVDFGYIVPSWLLQLPKIGPVNIHPSDLPKYRGSSPGQFVLMFGEDQSAVTLIQMDEKLDHGPIISKIYFEVDKDWTAAEYYAHAFELVSQQLPTLLSEYCKHPKTVSSQPDDSPTPVARMLSRDDGFVPIETIKNVFENKNLATPVPLLSTYQLESTAVQLYDMWRGLTPWPGIWTKIGEASQETRVKILEMKLIGGRLKITQIQVEGKLPTNNVDILFR
jgi:methionyl-tRNA formyltransferase